MDLHFPASIPALFISQFSTRDCWNHCALGTNKQSSPDLQLTPPMLALTKTVAAAVFLLANQANVALAGSSLRVSFNVCRGVMIKLLAADSVFLPASFGFDWFRRKPLLVICKD
jgi:hypothetical protein